MAQQCVHRGCGKKFTDSEEDCHFHPGTPIFHEGQKGWKCCKPRYLTFDEFLSIPPCTIGKHSVVDDTPELDPRPATIQDDSPPASKPLNTEVASQDLPAPRAPARGPPAGPSPVPSESESDDPSTKIPPNTACRRRGCNVSTPAEEDNYRNGEECIYHPGRALFHEGSKGWTCCKRRVLEFEEFMKIEGCKTKNKHLFVGKKQEEGKEKTVAEVRHDFYQTPTAVIVSLYLKKIDKERAKVDFNSPTTVTLDLPTADGKRYTAELPLFGHIDTTESTAKIMGTKLEMTLIKVDGSTWPTLRSDERRPNEIIQIGQAGKA